MTIVVFTVITSRFHLVGRACRANIGTVHLSADNSPVKDVVSDVKFVTFLLCANCFSISIESVGPAMTAHYVLPCLGFIGSTAIEKSVNNSFDAVLSGHVCVTTNHLTTTIKVCSMVTDWSHLLCLTCIVDAGGVNPAFNQNPMQCPILVFERGVFLHKGWIALYTKSVTIALSVVMGPLVTYSGVEPRAIARVGVALFGSTTIEKCVLHLIYVYSVTPVVVWI